MISAYMSTENLVHPTTLQLVQTIEIFIYTCLSHLSHINLAAAADKNVQHAHAAKRSLFYLQTKDVHCIGCKTWLAGLCWMRVAMIQGIIQDYQHD